MNPEKIVNFFFEVASLRRLTRSHRQFIGEVSDNISDHSFRTAIIGMILAELEKADVNKVIKMCLFHDLAEARTGDVHATNKFYVDVKEAEAEKDQLEGLPIFEEIFSLLEEYKRKETKESIVAKDADLIDQMLLQQEYFYKDPDGENHKLWQDFSAKGLKTQSAKDLAEKIRNTNPLEWHYEVYEKKSGKKLER
ncbi:HD domain-containing protein [Candidatus Wolfebacteria bacterium]|nr:HD domain-containing protein [Candidatus Wolfebacteria bacterium]